VDALPPQRYEPKVVESGLASIAYGYGSQPKVWALRACSAAGHCASTALRAQLRMGPQGAGVFCRLPAAGGRDA
jgi:hypothetical protein